MIVNGLTRLYAEIDLFRGADRLVPSESLAMRKLIALLVVGVLLSFGQIVSAGPLEDGVAAMKRGDYGRRPEFISISDGFRRSPKDDKRNRFGITCTAHRKASSYGVKTRSRV